MGFTPAVSLSTQIADHIGDQIIVGELNADDRIQELRIAKQLGVSRGSVREALLILEARGLVKILPRRGALVSGMECSGIAELAEVSAELLIIFFRRFAERLAISRKTDLSIVHTALEHAQKSAERGSVRDFTEARFDLVRAGLAMMRASYLSSLLTELMPSWHRLAVIAHRHSRADLHDDLRFTRALWDAVQLCDGARVEELIRAHCKREGRMAQEVIAS